MTAIIDEENILENGNIALDNNTSDVVSLDSNNNVEETLSLKDGKISTKKISKTGNKQGRPQLHPFAGRITILRDEVELALKDNEAFIKLMYDNHTIDEARWNTLVEAEEVLTSTKEMFYTFQGPIELVLEEMKSVYDKYNEMIEAGTATIRPDFKKKKIITAEDNPLYVQPIVNDKISMQIEAYPNIIYGYIRVNINA